MLCQKRIIRKTLQGKRCLAAVLALLVLLQFTPVTAEAHCEPIVFSQSGAAQEPRTACSLHREWEAITTPAKPYDLPPSTQYPFAPGMLSGDAIVHGLACVNFIRYVAGLPAVTTTAEDNLSAQYGAVLLAAANKLTHTPSRPTNMSDFFFWKASMALSQSNIFRLCLGSGSTAEQEACKLSLPLSIGSYMDEPGVNNRALVAHRRWLLNPYLQSVGIGSASTDSAVYQVLKVMGTAYCTGSSPDYDFIAWPASGVFPAQVISTDAPWSITLNPSIFRIPFRNNLTVKVSRGDGKCWTLNAYSSADSSSDSFLAVNTQPFGIANSIIFAFSAEDREIYTGSYRVTVSGLFTADGRAAILDYTTSFSDLNDPGHIWSNWHTDTPAACIEFGLARRECEQCGKTEEKRLEPLGHDWHPAVVLLGQDDPDKAEYICSRCQRRRTDLLSRASCSNGTCPCSAFLDMPASTSWAHNGIDFVVESGYFRGTSPSAFSPKGNMTRGMLVTVLWRMAGMPTPPAACDFSDMSPSQYYSDAVCWGSSTGIVNGVSSSCFAPGRYVTREQAITFLYRFFADASSPASRDVLLAYADAAQVRSYAADAMAWATQNGIIEGKPGGNGRMLLSPGDNITREQAAAIIMRCMQLAC